MGQSFSSRPQLSPAESTDESELVRLVPHRQQDLDPADNEEQRTPDLSRNAIIWIREIVNSNEFHADNIQHSSPPINQLLEAPHKTFILVFAAIDVFFVSIVHCGILLVLLLALCYVRPSGTGDGILLASYTVYFFLSAAVRINRTAMLSENAYANASVLEMLMTVTLMSPIMLCLVFRSMVARIGLPAVVYVFLQYRQLLAASCNYGAHCSVEIIAYQWFFRLRIAATATYFLFMGCSTDMGWVQLCLLCLSLTLYLISRCCLFYVASKLVIGYPSNLLNRNTLVAGSISIIANAICIFGISKVVFLYGKPDIVLGLLPGCFTLIPALVVLGTAYTEYYRSSQHDDL